MALLVGTVAATAALITLGLRSRLGLGRALAIGLAGSMVSTSVVGLMLLDADALASGPLLVGLLAALVGWAGLVVGLRVRWPVRWAASSDSTKLAGGLGLLLVIGVGMAIRSDPSPYLHGGQDQGIYVDVGHHIARTGRLRAVDRLVAGEVPGFPAEAIQATHELEPIAEDSPLAGVREGRWIAGLHIEDASEGRIIPAFFHLLPVWLAMTELELGFARSTWVLVVFAGLAQLGAFAVGYRLAAGEVREPGAQRRGWAVGLIAATTLVVHPLDLWISTFTVTENLARAALLGSAGLALEATTAERRAEPGVVVMAGLAGLVFAAGAFARGSMLAMAIVLALALVVVRREVPRTRWALLVTLVVGTTLAAVQGILHSWPYFFSAASNHFYVPKIRPFQAEAVAWTVVAGGSVLLADRGLGRLRQRWPRLTETDSLVRIAALLVLVGALAAMIYRALDSADGFGPSQQVGVVLLRYGGPVGLGLGLVGLVFGSWFAPARLQAWLVLAMAVVLATALKPGIRYEFYYARYLVGDVIPVLIVAAAWALGEAARWLAARWGPRVAALGLALALSAWWAPSLFVLGRPVFWTRDLEHSPEALAEIFDRVPADAVLFFDARLPGRWRGSLATPAFLAFDKTVLVYPNQRLIERGLAIGTPIYMLSGGWELADHQRWPNPVHGPSQTTVVARGHYRARRAEVVEGAMPERLTEWGGAWELHRLDPSIWRSSGRFSLYPGSRFIAHAGPGQLESVALDWQAGAVVELLVEPGSLAGCTPSAALVLAGVERLSLSLLPEPSDRLYRFGLPAVAVTSAAIEIRWPCSIEQLPWRRLSSK